MHYVRRTQKFVRDLKDRSWFQFLFFSNFTFLVHWNFDLHWNEKCTLLLKRLLVLQIYCFVVGVNNVVTGQRLWVWYCYVLSTLKVQLTVELVKCTLLLNRLLVLQIYCCVVGVNTVATEQKFRISVQSVGKVANGFGTLNWLNFRLQSLKTEDNWKYETVREKCMAWAFFVTALSIDAVFVSTLERVQDT